MEKSEEGSSDEYSTGDSEASRQHRIQVAAKNGFLNYGGKKHGHQHQQKRAAAVLEKILDRQIGLGPKRCRSNLNHNRKKKSARDQAQIRDTSRSGPHIEPFPADRPPERRAEPNPHLSGEISEQPQIQESLRQNEEKALLAHGFLKLCPRYAEQPKFLDQKPAERDSAREVNNGEQK